MKRTRKVPYYYITDIGNILPDVDNRSERDKQRFELGNYFISEDEARQAQKEFISFFRSKKTLLQRIKSIIRWKK